MYYSTKLTKSQGRGSINVMKLAREQVDVLSGYFADISKVIAASTVIGFFLPTSSGQITFQTAAIGVGIAVTFIIVAVAIKQGEQ